MCVFCTCTHMDISVSTQTQTHTYVTISWFHLSELLSTGNTWYRIKFVHITNIQFDLVSIQSKSNFFKLGLINLGTANASTNCGDYFTVLFALTKKCVISVSHFDND